MQARLVWARRMLFEAVKIVGVTYAGLCAASLVLPERLLYQPHAKGYADGPGIVKLEVAPGVRISAAYDPAPGARFTVVFSHGNAEDLGDRRWFVQRWNALGVSVLSYDYEGYGTSDGAPSEAKLYRDIDAVYDYATGKLGVAPEHLIVYGRSLGGGPTVDIAARRRVGGVILESTFASAFRVATRVRLIPWDQFENLAKMPRVSSPVLVLHGTDDALIPIGQGRALFEAARAPKRSLWVQGGEHANTPFVAGRAYEVAIRDLLGLIAR